MARQSAYYCKENDILIVTDGKLRDAVEFAQYKLSPAYGHPAGRADNLKLRKISMAEAEDLKHSAIFWED